MNYYVIWLQDGSTKVFVKLNTNGSPTSVSDKLEATAFPNRCVASLIVEAIKSAIKKNSLNVDIGFDLVKSSGSPVDK